MMCFQCPVCPTDWLTFLAGWNGPVVSLARLFSRNFNDGEIFCGLAVDFHNLLGKYSTLFLYKELQGVH